MTVFKDNTAYIQDGDIDLKKIPTTWDEYIPAFTEFLFVVNYFCEAPHYKYLYDNVYKKLVVEDGDKEVYYEDDKTKEIRKYVLPTLKRQNEINDVFSELPEGLLSEACFQFALFLLCREFAKISGRSYLSDSQEKKLKEAFSAVDSSESASLLSKMIFERYKDAIKNGLKEDIGIEISDSNLRGIATMFNPQQTNEMFYNSIDDINLLKNRKSKVVSIFKKETCLLLNEFARNIHKCISNELYFDNMMYAFGNESTSKGILGLDNVGLFLFPYPNEISIEKKNVNKDNVIHICAFGFDFVNSATEFSIKIKTIEDTIKYTFEGNSLIYDEIRPKRKPNTTIPDSYRTNNTENETSIDVISDGLETIKSNMIFNRMTKNLFFATQFLGGELSVSKEENIHGEDEFFLILNIANKKDIPLSQGNPMSFVNVFEDDKFEVTKTMQDKMFTLENLCLLQELVNIINRNSPTIHTNIEGWYIGKWTYSGVLADSNYIPSSNNSPKKEYSDFMVSDERLRYSKATIEKNEEGSEIIIDIVSTTSPRRSNLKDEFKSPHINENKGHIFKDIDKYVYKEDNNNVVYYNQPLAMLRSMGVLEAIAKEIYRIDPSTKGKLDLLMKEAFAVDKSGKARGNDNAYYQLPEEKAISYAEYKSFKWYKDLEDYNQYDHSINFDTIENNNN